MTIIDANYFLRTFVRPTTAQDRALSQTTTLLFQRVAAGQEMIIVTDAVVAEVIFILASPRHYGLPRPDVTDRLKPLLSLPGCRLTRKRLVLLALDLWATSPALSFVDALGATYARELHQPLASFDTDLGKVPRITLWKPPTADGTT